jgi:hypothetical protein
MRILTLSFVLVMAASNAQLALSDSLYTFGAVNKTFTDEPVTLGFVFTANSTFEVTSLGWFDGTGNGFQSPHTIGLFDSAGNLLISTVVGTSDSFSDSFRYHPIAPITLEAGNDYTLAGTSGGQLDSWTVNDFVSGFTMNSAFTVGSNAARFSYGTELVDPSSHFSDYLVYAGPNLERHGVTSATPEPAGLVLVLLGVTALLAVRRIQGWLSKSRFIA